jgi:hypothetical protein
MHSVTNDTPQSASNLASALAPVTASVTASALAPALAPAFAPAFASALVFFLACVVLVPLVFFGLDFTDAGYSTAIAWTQATMPQAADWTLNTFGTPVLVGTWFKLTGWHSLVGFRCCWVLLMASGAVALFRLIQTAQTVAKTAPAPTTTTTPATASMLVFVLTALVLATFNSEEVIVPEYHNFPPILGLVAMALLMAAVAHRIAQHNNHFHFNQNAGNHFNNHFNQSFNKSLPSQTLSALAGFVMAFATLARLPMLLLFVVMMLVLVLYDKWNWRSESEGVSEGANARPVLALLGGFVLGFVVGVGAALMFVHWSGFTLERIIAGSAASQRANTEFMRTDGPALGYLPLWKSTALRYAKVVSMGAALLLLCGVWKRLQSVFAKAESTRRELKFGAELALLLGFAVITVKVVRSGATGFLGFHYGPITSILLGAPLLVAALTLVLDFKRLPAERRVLLLLALAFFAIASLGGSGVWVGTFRHGAWLLVPAVLLECFPRGLRLGEFAPPLDSANTTLATPTTLATSTTPTTLAKLVDMRLLGWMLIVGIATLGVALRVEMPYRDKPVYALDAAFNSAANATEGEAALSGIRTSSGRARATSELLHAAAALGLHEGDTIQAYPDGALLYFLTKTRPWYKDTWIGMQWTRREDIADFASDSVNSAASGSASGLPSFVLRLKFDPNAAPSLDAAFLAQYPAARFQLGSDSIYYGFLNKPASRYLDSLWMRHGYTVAWENAGFVILKRP